MFPRSIDPFTIVLKCAFCFSLGA